MCAARQRPIARGTMLESLIAKVVLFLSTAVANRQPESMTVYRRSRPFLSAGRLALLPYWPSGRALAVCQCGALSACGRVALLAGNWPSAAFVPALDPSSSLTRTRLETRGSTGSHRLGFSKISIFFAGRPPLLGSRSEKRKIIFQNSPKTLIFAGPPTRTPPCERSFAFVFTPPLCGHWVWSR